MRATGRLVCFLAIMASLCGLMFSMWAQDESITYFTVSTLEIDEEVPPGTEQRGSFVVTNLADVPIVVTVGMCDWMMDPNGEVAFFEPGRLVNSIAPFVTLSDSKFELGPKESREVEYAIAIPQGEEAPHWGAFLVEGNKRTSEGVGTEEGGGIRISIGVVYGIKILQTPSKFDSNAAITAFDLKSNREASLTFNLGIKNLGRTFLKPDGVIEVRDTTGQTILEGKIEPALILPGSNRILKAQVEGELLPGEYLALAIIDYGGDQLLAAQRVFEVPR